MPLIEPDDVEVALPNGPGDWRVTVGLGVGCIGPLGQQELGKGDVVLFASNHQRSDSRFIGRIVENRSVVEEQLAYRYASRVGSCV